MDSFFEKFCVFLALFLVGMYFGSVIGYLTRLTQWTLQSRTENPLNPQPPKEDALRKPSPSTK